MKLYRDEKQNSAELLEVLEQCDTISYNRRKNTFTFYAHEGALLEDVENADSMDLVKLANALDKRYFYEATIGCSSWNWDDEDEEDEKQEDKPKAEDQATEEATQEDETMKTRYFYIPDIDSTMCVEISTKKEMIDLLDETIRFNCTDEECIFDIIYKDGSEIRIDENNRKYKKTGIAAIVNDNGTTVQVCGAFEINENGIVYPALTEKIDENIIEVSDWNYHAPTEEEIENMIAEEVEKEYFGETSAAVPNLYRNEPDNAPEVREMLRSCSHIQFDWRRNHAIFYKCEREIGRAVNVDNMDLQKVAQSLGKSYDRTW